MGGFDDFVNTSFLLRPALVSVRPDTAARAAHYRVAAYSVNTPAHLFLSPFRFRCRHRGGARIVHGNNRFGKGVRQLDAKLRLRNGAITNFKEPIHACDIRDSLFFKHFDERLR